MLPSFQPPSPLPPGQPAVGVRVSRLGWIWASAEMESLLGLADASTLAGHSGAGMNTARRPELLGLRSLISLPKILWLRTPPKHSLSPPQTPPRPTSASPASPDADGLCTLKLAQPPKHSSEGGGASAPWQGWTGAQMHSSS